MLLWIVYAIRVYEFTIMHDPEINLKHIWYACICTIKARRKYKHQLRVNHVTIIKSWVTVDHTNNYSI